MGCQVRRLRESLKTVRIAANIWFLPSVGPQVGPQVEVKAESLVTDFALVGLFPCVDELVSFELGVVEELFLATFDGANKHAFTVGHLVLAERAVVGELFEAVLDVAFVDAVQILVVAIIFVFGVARVVVHKVHMVSPNECIDLSIDRRERVHLRHFKSVLIP